MAIDALRSSNRRALIGAALAGATAYVAQAALRPALTLAAGEPMAVGGTYPDATGPTTLSNQANNSTVIVGESLLNGPGTGDGTGVAGSSVTGIGVNGSSTSGVGIRGRNASSTTAAVLGYAQGDGAGVYGFSGGGSPAGVRARTGVYGYASQDSTAVGVFGRSAKGDGVQGDTGATGKSGVYGHTSNAAGWALNGSNDEALTNGYVGGANGVLGQARGSTGSGVVGYSGTASVPVGPSDTGVFGASDSGRGAVVRGKVAPLRLVPSMASSHPSAGAKGDLFVDSAGRLWVCRGGMFWKQLA